MSEYTPLTYWWLHENPTDQQSSESPQWVPFTTTDNYALEAAYHLSKHTQTHYDKDPNFVLVNGGRYQVDMRDRRISCLYWNEPSRKVIRGSWFFSSGATTSSHLIPYSEEESSKIEETFFPQNTSNFERNTPKRYYLLNNTHYISDRNEMYIPELSDETKEMLPEYWQFTNEKTLPRMVHRGLPDSRKPIPEYDESVPVRHLVFVVHGIGEHLWSRDIRLGSFKVMSHTENVNHVRTIGYELDDLSTNATLKDLDEKKKRSRVEFLPIHWHHLVHTKDFQDRISRTSLPSIGPVRVFSNQVLIDSLIYLSVEGQTQIQNAVIEQLNSTYKRFRQFTPDFEGKVSIMGHSLGSVITFDILRSHSDKLEFRPQNLYTLGSPIGLFYTATANYKYLSSELTLPTCPHVWNIFHPHDPVAYRIEPLLDSEHSKLEPVTISSKHAGVAAIISSKVQRLTDYVSGFWSRGSLAAFSDSIATSNTPSDGSAPSFFTNLASFSPFNFGSQKTASSPVGSSTTTTTLNPLSEKQELAITPPKPTIKKQETHLKMNQGIRIDYSLRETILDKANNYLSSMTVHVSYFSNIDGIGFIMDTLDKASAASDDEQLTNTTSNSNSNSN